MNTPEQGPRIVLDGVIFQLFNSGIARLWRSLLREWAATPFGRRLTVVDRAATAPRVDGPRYVAAPAYDYACTDRDAEMLQRLCDEEGAGAFASTYYTTPLGTPSVFMAYDLIPERLGSDLNAPPWREKQVGVAHASAYICISQSTADELRRFYPEIASERVTVAYPGVGAEFVPEEPAAAAAWRRAKGISRPYFLLAGERSGLDGYKNAGLFFRALATLPDRARYAVVCTGGRPELEDEYRALAEGMEIHLLRLDDAGLRAAYSGALALVYPSKCEGFGLPVLEAMACGCPAITCFNTSLPEVAGDAAFYVGEDDVSECAAALLQIQRPETRALAIARGLARARQFSWARIAAAVADALHAETARPRQDAASTAGVWRVVRRLQQGYQGEILALRNQSQERLERLLRAEADHDDARRTIAAMEATKFWKMRGAWLRTKATGLRLLKGRAAG